MSSEPREFINKSKAAGKTDNEIIQSLVQAGWQTSQIEPLLQKSTVDKIAPPALAQNSNLDETPPSIEITQTGGSKTKIVIGLCFLVILGILIGGWWIWRQQSKKDFSQQELNKKQREISPTLSANSYTQQAEKFFLAVKERDAEKIYAMLSEELKTEINKNKIVDLLNSPDSYVEQLVGQKEVKSDDITVITRTGENRPGKKYLGSVSYSSGQEGALEITFVNENNEWKINKFNFSRQKFVNSGNIDNDFLELKQMVKFKLYKPTYLPSGYLYEGSTYDLTNNNVPDGKIHEIVFSAYADRKTKTQLGGSKDTIFYQLNYKISYEELLSFVKSKASSNQAIEEVNLDNGKAIFVSGGIIPSSLVFAKDDSIVTIQVDDSIDKGEIIKIANLLTEVK